MSIVVAVLVGLAVATNLASAVGALAMRDPLQRLHYLAPASSLAPLALAIALLLGESDKQAGTKALLLTLLLTAANGVVTHQTARAHRIRDRRPFADLADDER
jgi:multisubunit Na+/H+ antiporter MnhG subunit